MKNGKMKIAPASEIRASESPPAHLYRIRKTSEFFRKLSLKALKNWHQNRGANRRVVKRLVDMQGIRAQVAALGRQRQTTHSPRVCRRHLGGAPRFLCQW